MHRDRRTSQRTLVLPSYTQLQPGAFVIHRCCKFPVRLTFTTTVKPQGQSARHVDLDLHYQVFSYDRLYFALPRATSGDRIKAVLPGEDAASLRTTNVVWLFAFCVLAFTHVVGGIVQCMVNGVMLVGMLLISLLSSLQVSNLFYLRVLSDNFTAVEVHHKVTKQPS